MGQHNLAPMQRVINQSIPEPNSGCWLWLGACGSSGYPQMTVKDENTGKRKSVRVTRYMCFGSIDPETDLFALHKCDVKICVNPDHLYSGTQNQNVHDAISRDLWPKRNGENSKTNKITWADADAIRRSSETNRKLAKRYGIANSRISDIKTGKSWRQNG